MIYKVLITVLLMISSISGAAVDQNVKKSPSILEDIMTEVNTNNSDICPTPKDILGSEYVKECAKLSFPPANTTLKTGNNHNMFLCLALYDRAYHICHISSRDLKIPELQSKTAFDGLIADEITHNKRNSYKVCDFFENVNVSAVFKKTQSFVKELSIALKEPEECPLICWYKQEKKVNPLCIVIQVIDEKIQKAEKQKEIAVKEVEVKKNGTSLIKTDAKSTKVVTPAAPIPPSNPQTNLNPSAGDSDHVGVKKTNDQSPVEKNPLVEDVKSKPKAGSEVAEKVEENSLTQEQSPPLLEDNVKKEEASQKDAAVPKDKGSPSQVVAPGDDAGGKEVEKSTVSEHTGGDDADAMGNEETIDDAPLGLGDEDQMPQEDPVNQVQKNQDTFEQPIRKSSHITPEDDSHFFGYFTLFGLFGIGLFAAYHHKHKIFAMLLEGRRSRGGRGRRRPSTANYRKLDCTLEEAVTSQCNSNPTHVIY